MVAFLIFIFLFGYFQQSASTDAITDYQPNKVNVIVRRVLGGILIALGIFGVITSIILFSLRSGGILPDDSSDLDIQLGFFMFSIVWGSYVRMFIPSDICNWKKVCKAVGYTLLCIALYLPCFIPSYALEYHSGVDTNQIILYISFFSIALLSVSILLIRLSRKREARLVLHKNDKTNKTILDAEQQQTDTIQTVIDITDSPLSNAVNAEESQVSINHTHRIRSFQENINLVLFIVSGVFLIASIVFFIVFLSAYRNEEIYCFFWLIFSFISSVAISVWYYLNQHHIAINCIKKYGITFMITAFVLCISPFYAIASLIIGAKCTKQVFDIDASTKQ